MTVKYEIYFQDLKPEKQEEICKILYTTADDENWDVAPLAVIEREVDDPYP